MNAYDIRPIGGEFGVYISGSDELIIVHGTLRGAINWTLRKAKEIKAARIWYEAQVS